MLKNETEVEKWKGKSDGFSILKVILIFPGLDYPISMPVIFYSCQK